jgi:hypothetical protein
MGEGFRRESLNNEIDRTQLYADDDSIADPSDQ